jgi:hypothetical protein
MTARGRGLIAVAAVAVVWAQSGVTDAAPLTDAQVCEVAKLTAAAKKEACLANERIREVKGKIPAYERCSDAFTRALARAETKAGAGVCPSEGDAVAIEALIDGCFADLSAALAGSPNPSGPPCAPQPLPATGQTTCWDSAGRVIACAGTGQDGDIRAGAPLGYTDNGDGTITDTRTGLMWEKKSLEGTVTTNLHHRDRMYTWADAFAEHVTGLNAGGGFAGHTDWRLPNIKELQSIADYEHANPSVPSAFNIGCVASCTVLTCSCTASSAFYWSSSTSPGVPANALGVHFSPFNVVHFEKRNPAFVRAVRGGV